MSRQESMARLKHRLSQYGLMGLVVAGVFLLFLGPLASGRGLYGGDFYFYFYPLKKFILEHLLTHGALPFWNSYQFSGTPMISNIQASMFYPFGFLYYLISPERAYVYSTFMHCLMAGFFMYAFVRSIPVSKAGSLMAALVFTFNGFFLGHVYAGHLTFVQSYVWIPLLFLLIHHFARTGNLVWAVGAGLVVGTQILGGFPQIAFYTLLASTLFGLSRIVILRRHGSACVFKLGTGLGVCLVLGFCLAAVQILPTLQFTGLSTRGGGVSYATATYESLHPKELLAFLIPGIYGSPLDQTYWRSQEVWHFWESCGYGGMLPLFLLFVQEVRPGLRKFSGFFYLLAALALFLALGKYNPLYPLIYRMPGFNSFRIPAQIIYLYVFSVAVLSGIGLGKITEGPWRFSRAYNVYALLVGGVVAVAFVGIHFFPFKIFFFLFRHFAEGPVTHANLTLLYGEMIRSIDRACLFFFLSLLILFLARTRRLSPGIFSFLGCGMLFLDLFLFGKPFIRTYDYGPQPQKKEMAALLPRRPFQGRVVTMGALFKSNDGLQYGFPSVLGYDPLILKRYVEYILSSQGQPFSDHVVNLAHIFAPESKLLSLLHVTALAGDRGIHPLKNEIPYAHVVSHAWFERTQEVLAFMKSDRFEPLKGVVLEGHGKTVDSHDKEIKPAKSSCTVENYEEEHFTIRASADQPGYLVVSEVYYPGWHCMVDGKEVKIQRGNYLFRVVPLEAGIHHIRFYFVSWPFRIGGILSLLSLGAALCFILMRRKEGQSGLESRSLFPQNQAGVKQDSKNGNQGHADPHLDR
jgi:Bacterial membrane protein YfhO